MDFLVEWKDGTSNIVTGNDLLPALRVGNSALWAYDITWRCKIISFENFNCVLVKWANDDSENVVSLNDLQISSESQEAIWRYDFNWEGKIIALNGKIQKLHERNYEFRSKKVSKTLPIPNDSGSEESERDDEVEPDDETSCSDDSDDDVPLQSFRSNNMGRSPLWKQKTDQLTNREWKGGRKSAEKVRKASEYFQDYFTTEFIEHICYQTNLYVCQKNPDSTFCLSKATFSKFVGCCYWMSLIGMSSTRRYWSPLSRCAQVADSLTRNEWDDVKRNLHFADNNETIGKKDGKFCFLIQHFNSIANKIPFDEMLCVDEQIVPTKTRRTTLRQYNPKKPKKWGFKIFMLCGQSGFVHNIEFYLGKDHNGPGDLRQEACASTRVVAAKCTLFATNVRTKTTKFTCVLHKTIVSTIFISTDCSNR